MLGGAEALRLDSSSSEDTNEFVQGNNGLEVVSMPLGAKIAVSRPEAVMVVPFEKGKGTTVAFEAGTVQFCVLIVPALSEVESMIASLEDSGGRVAVVVVFMSVALGQMRSVVSGVARPSIARNATPDLFSVALSFLSDAARSGILLLLGTCQVLSTVAGLSASKVMSSIVIFSIIPLFRMR